MALLNVDLLANGETVLNSQNAADGDVVNLNVLGSGTLVVDGVDVSIDSIVGVAALSSPTFAAQNGGVLTLSQGLLSVNLLSNPTFEIRDDGTVNLDASALSLGLTETLLNRFDVRYVGDDSTGRFAYDPPAISVLALGPQTFNVTGMEATDVFAINGRTNLRLDAPLSGFPPSRDPEDAYRDGVLHLVSPAIPLVGERVNLEIPMTQEEFDLFLSDQSAYLTGSSFTFPGQLAAPCFLRGTMILTENGEVAVEDLVRGDRVVTRDNGSQPIRWIASRRIPAGILARHPELRPIRIPKGALGPDLPARDLIVSPQHRVLVRSRIAQRMFGAVEVLVAARQLVGIADIARVDDGQGVEYVHFMFDRHEIVFSEGAETESLFAGPQALRSLGGPALTELLRIFPQLRQGDAAAPARTFAFGRKARTLVARHRANDRPLCI